MSEKTSPQIATGVMIGRELSGSQQSIDPTGSGRMYRRNYKLFREMRRDPTIAFARMLAVAPLVTAGWSYEETEYAPPGAKDFIKEQLDPLRAEFVKSALEGYIDFGWAPFEKVWCVDEEGYNSIKKLKPLLQENTEILINPNTGEFWGLRVFNTMYAGQTADMKFGEVDLLLDSCVNIALDVEGTDWYGVPLMVNAIDPYFKHRDVEKAAARYDNKIAGAHWVVYYPPGQSDLSGTMTDNFEIAKQLLSSLQSSGACAIPSTPSAMPDTMDMAGAPAWKVEILTDSGAASANFTNRQKYLDALKVRAFGMPERAILEGQFGTKAEADSHADFAIVNYEVRHATIAREVNRQVVNQLLLYNFGPGLDGTVTVVPTPLSDETIGYLRTMMTALMSNPDVLLNEYPGIDMDAIAEQLKIPRRDPQAALQVPTTELDPYTGQPLPPAQEYMEQPVETYTEPQLYTEA